METTDFQRVRLFEPNVFDQIQIYDQRKLPHSYLPRLSFFTLRVSDPDETLGVMEVFNFQNT